MCRSDSRDASFAGRADAGRQSARLDGMGRSDKMRASERSTLMLPDEYRIMFDVEDRYWWYRALRWWVKAALLSNVDRGATVLDAGCGTGATLVLLKNLGYRPFAIDPSSEGMRLASSREGTVGRLCRGLSDELPFARDSFDCVVSCDLLQLLPDDEEKTALREFRRVIKPGGVLLINLPACRWLEGEHDQAVSTRRRYSASELQSKLLKYGFQPVRMEYRHMIFLPVLATVRFLRGTKRQRSRAQSDLAIPLGPLNTLMAAVACMEEWVGRMFVRPVGTSISVVAKLPE